MVPLAAGPSGARAGDLADEGGWAARLRRVCLYIFAALPLVFVFSRDLGEVMIIFIGLAFLAVVFGRRRWDILTRPLVAAPVAIWLYLMFVNAPLAGSEIPAVLGRAAAWLRFLCLFGAAVFWLFAEADDFRKVALAWGVALGLIVVDGTVQGLFGTSLSGRGIFEGERLTGPLRRPNIGKYVVFLFYPALAAYLISGEAALDRRRIAVLAAAMAAVAFFVVFTGERSATLVSLAAVTFAALVLMARGPGYRLAGALALVASYAITAFTVLGSARLRMRIEPTAGVVGDFWNSPYGELVRAAVSVWRAQPATGVGLGNFDVVCKLREPDLVFGCLPHPHNIYLEWLSETGIIGLAAFLVFVGVVLASVFLALRRYGERPVLVSLLVACPILTLFPLVPTQSFFSNWPAILWWTSLAMSSAVAMHLNRVPPPEAR